MWLNEHQEEDRDYKQVEWAVRRDKPSPSEALQRPPQRYSFMLASAQNLMGATIQCTTDHLGEWVKWEDVASQSDKKESNG